MAGHADDLRLADIGVGDQHFFNFARRDVFAAADNHVLEPADDVDIAGFLHDGEVARVHPAGCIDGGIRGGFVVPVAAHNAVAARAKLAGLAARYKTPCRWITHADLDMRLHAPDGADAAVQR